MSSKNAGGAAFPRAACISGLGNVISGAQAGLTLRDWFAGRATEEDIGAHTKREWVSGAIPLEGYHKSLTTREAAKYAYADAMIAQRDAD